MNTPIIDPMIFYMIEMADRIINLPVYFGFIALIVFALLVMLFCNDITDENSDSVIERVMVPMLILEIFFIVVSFFMPSPETLYKMLIMEHVTPANIESFGNNVDKLLSVLAEKIIYIGKALK